MFKMRELHKIINIAVIFMILGCWEGQGLACSSDIFYLRVPVGIDKNRAAEILARDGGTEGLPEDSQALKAKRKEQEKIERAVVAIRSLGRFHGNKFFDYEKRLLRIQPGIDYMDRRIGEDTLLGQKLNHMQKIINDTKQRLLHSAINVRLDSKQDTLTVSSAETYINDLKQAENSLALLRQQIEEVRQGLNREYQVAEELRDPFTIRCTRALEAIDEFAEMLQSKIEIAAATSSASRMNISNAINEMSGWDEVITLVNNLPSLSFVQGNRLTLSSAIWNIVNNARYFAKQKQGEAARVNIRFTEENGFVRIDIADNGPGIPADLLEFDPLMKRSKLFNLNVSQREGGTGLGTTEAWYAIKDAHGTIEVQSELDKGATFTIRLPIAQDSQPFSPPNALLAGSGVGYRQAMTSL